MSAAPAVHRTLGRQLRRLGLQQGSAPSAAAWTELLEAVSTAYGEADDERYTLERSIEVSSREMRGLHEVLSRRALQDPLTGLPNRAALLADLDARLGGGAGRRDVAVLFIDLDGFKKVNDGLGHAAGDELLVRAAERIRSCLRPTDVVARLGGDEFVVVCDGDAAAAAAVARRIGTELAAPFRVAEQDASISGSIGLATTGDGPDGRDGPEDLLRRADLAMYDAKVSGRARTSVFDASMETGATSRAALRAELSAALRRDELRLVHQPVVDLADGRLVGFEALVRWVRPGGEVLAPEEFLPAAEEGSLVAEVDRWVVTEALLRGAAWCRAGGRLSVNASARSLEGDALVGAVGAALQRTGVPARSLVVEVPEAALAGSHRAADRTLEHLRGMGVGIALDGFGTGTSSLAQLQHPRADVVKVAPALVARVDADPVAAAVVGAVVSVARASGLTVVAVGVERQAQADVLRAQGCHQAQGWLFGRPEDDAPGPV